MIPVTAVLQRHRRLAIGFAAVLTLIGLYAAVGFWAVPWYAERQLVSTAQDRLDLNASTESIQFNPFTFVITVNGLSLNDNG